MIDSNQLFVRNLGLAYHFANRFYVQHYNIIDKSELEQISLIALWKSTLKFNPHHGSQFTTYASRAIINDLVRIINRTIKRSKIVTFQDGHSFDRLSLYKQKVNIGDYLPSSLSNRERHIVFAKLSGLTLKEIRTTKKYYKRIKRKILRANS
jgi:RNA polymerase sigma factor (sigma-70 family)